MPLIPPPPVSPAAARRARPSPRSVATRLSPTQSKSSGFDASEEDENSFLAGFARSLKFHDDDESEFDPSTSSNPFRKSKAATASNSNPAISDATAASTNLFLTDFESTNPFTEDTAPPDKFTSNYEEEPAMSDYYTSEATTAVRTNSSVLSGRLLSNLSAQSVTVSEDNMLSPKVANNQSKSDDDRKNLNTATVYTVKDELHRANSRGRKTNREEDSQHRSKSRSRSRARDVFSDRDSKSHARQKYRHRQLRSESFEDASLPTIDDGSFGTNSFTLRDNDTYLTDGDSFTLDDESYIPRGYSRRRGGGARFLCGCDDNDVAHGMNELRAAFKDINKVVEASFWCVMPNRSVRRHSSYRERERNYDDRPSRSRSRSRSITRRSRSTSARRNGERPTSKVRGQSVEPSAEPKKRMEPTFQPSPSAEILL
jgi:hypothetical protein